jgi:hypothetical protein
MSYVDNCNWTGLRRLESWVMERGREWIGIRKNFEVYDEKSVWDWFCDDAICWARKILQAWSFWSSYTLQLQNDSMEKGILDPYALQEQ